MTYIAEINVRQGGRPEIGDVTQFRVPGGGTSLMRVKISRGTPGPAPARAAAPQPAPRPAPVVPATPAPEPKAQPAPKQEPPASEPSAPKTPPHPMPRTPPANPVPTPTPPSPPPPAALPTPAPVPPAEAPPVDAVRIRTAKDRTCVECQPGETALSTEWVISGAGSCGGDLAAKLKGGSVPDLPGGCHVLRISLPAGARYTAYRYEVQDGKESLDCPTAQPCPNNIGRWPGDPILVKSSQGTAVFAPFESGTGGEGRRAVLTVYYSTGKK
jgi:hypothetical protein